MPTMTIGRLSRESGVKVPTIRYYEGIGLLPPPARSSGNRRLYGEEAAFRLRFIRHARDLGFSIEAIRALAVLAECPGRPCTEAHRLARLHLAEIEEKISRLSDLREELLGMIDDCPTGRAGECEAIHILCDHRNCLHHDR